MNCLKKLSGFGYKCFLESKSKQRILRLSCLMLAQRPSSDRSRTHKKQLN
jgi:hypothetical protein